MARASMEDLINRFRSLGNASDSDVFDGITYWSENQLEAILDNHRVYRQIDLTTVDTAETLHRVDMKRQYKLEEGEFTVYDSTETEISDTFTYSIKDNHITSALTQDDVSYLEGWVYSLYDALVELYDRKAAQREFYTRMKSGNNNLELQQEYEHCIARRDYYRNKVIRTVDIKRLSRWST